MLPICLYALYMPNRLGCFDLFDHLDSTVFVCISLIINGLCETARRNGSPSIQRLNPAIVEMQCWDRETTDTAMTLE